MLMQNARIKLLAALLSMIMVAGFLPVSVAAAPATVTYINENGAVQTVTATILENTTTTLTTGWYVVTGSVSTTNLSVFGNVNLILADGGTLTAGATGNNAAIGILNPSTLTVYGQTLGTGALNAAGSGRGAGIGGNGGADGSTGGTGQAGEAGGYCGTVTVVGGRVSANRVGGGDGGKGISAIEDYKDGGRGGNGGAIAVKGGSLTVAGKVGGGDGGESEYGHGGDGGDLVSLTVVGGIVNIGNIGGGNGGDGDYAYTPLGGGIPAAIGVAGDGGSGGAVAISGGTVHVSGKVGGGNAGCTNMNSLLPGTGGDGSTITISGGTVNIGGMIGGGSGSPLVGEPGGDGSCVITGGSLTAAALRPVPSNGSANGSHTVLVTPVTLSGVTKITAVKYLVSGTTYTYGTKDINTDATGNLSLWLPAGAAVTLAYTAYATYSGSVAAGATGTLAEIPLEAVKPTVRSVTPADGAENVPASGSLSVTFSEMMDASAGTISLAPAEGSIVVLTGGTWSSGNTVFTIMYSGLAQGMAYTLVIAGFTDLAGNMMLQDDTYDFRILPPVVIPIGDYSYLDETGAVKTVSAVKIDSSAKTLTSGWYAVEGSLSLTNMTISGDVRLILTDGCTLAVNGTDNNAGIRVKSGNSLTIYGQQLGTGSINATSAGRGAGIGGSGLNASNGESCGTVAVNGGQIATSRIGGGDGAPVTFSAYSGGSGGTVTINGGTVVVSGRIGGGDGGAGISMYLSGGNGGNGSSLSINGGNVTVSGKIGGGAAGSGSSMLGLTASAGGPGSCAITGGSVKVASMQPTPRNGSANGNLTVLLTTVTLGGVSTAQAVKALVTNAAATYGTRDMKTDTAGKLYLWLPSGTAVTAAFSTVNRYAGLISAGASGTLALATIDTQKPVVSSATPADGTNDVPVNGSIAITFSKVMDIGKGCITLSSAGSSTVALTGGVWTYSGTIYTIPYSGLSFSQTYTVALTGFQDISGFTADSGNLGFTSAARPKSIAVGAQSGTLINGAAGSATFLVSTVSIETTAAITLNNINNVTGITLGTFITAGDSTTMTISTTTGTPAGTHPLTITIDGITSGNFNLIVGARVCSISLSQTGQHAFLEQDAGYAPVTGHSVTITNTGNSPTGAITIGLTGEDNGCFTLSEIAMPDIAVSGSSSFTIRPNDSLPAGTYTAIVTVSGTNIAPQTFDVRFTVNKRTGNNVNGVTCPAAVISGTNIIASVENDVASQLITLSVSAGASWRLYRDIACTEEIADETMALSDGANIAFIKVIAEDGNAKLYALVIVRMEALPGLSSSAAEPDGALAHSMPPADSSAAIPKTGEDGSTLLSVLLGFLLLCSAGVLWVLHRRGIQNRKPKT